MSSTPPEITLELSGGALTIRTKEAVYKVVVPQVGLPAAPALPPAAEPPSLPPPGEEPPSAYEPRPPADPAAVSPSYKPADASPPDAVNEEETAFYRELSNDMYREVGSLARRLNVSLKDVEISRTQGLDLEDTGVQLAEAKDQLQGVVEMTEKAANRIIDLSEEIQGSADRAREIMKGLGSAEDGAPAQDAPPEENPAQDNFLQAARAVAAYLEAMSDSPLGNIARLAADLAEKMAATQAAPQPAPEPKPAPEPEPAPAPAEPWFQFPLDLVFQTIYELCTNETVKKHLKLMWDKGPASFDAKAVEEALNAIAPKTPDEDNFLNLDLSGVLKTLFAATGEDSFKNVLKKMAGSINTLFLEPSLPLEAIPGENPAAAQAAPPPAPEPAPEPAPPVAPALDPELATSAQALVAAVNEAAGKLAPPQLEGSLESLAQAACAPPESKGETQAMPVGAANQIAELDQALSEILGSVNNIVETSSFQDLSGQAIYRIVRLLSSFQVQLMAMVVSFGAKLKSKAVDAGITTDEGDKMAQEEVDKMLTTLGVDEAEQEGPAGESGELDQNAVDAMLDSMGF